MGPNPGRGVSGSMQKLHVVGYAADQGGFVLAARKGAKSGSYFLALDDSLLEQLAQARRGEQQAAPEEPVRPPRVGSSSALTPREIQTRLRAGRSIEEVAEEAGVGVDWVDRFAAPVLAEQAAAVERAGRAVLHTPRRGPSDRPLEASVRRNLAERGVVMAEGDYRNAWSARYLIDTDWLVTFQFRNRGRVMTAEWMFNAANGALTTRNRLGADLGYLEPERRLGPPGSGDSPEAAATSRPARRSVPARKAPARKAPARKAPARKAPARQAAAKASFAPKSTPEKAPGRQVGATPDTRAAARKAPAPKTPIGKVADPVPTPARVPAPAPAPARLRRSTSGSGGQDLPRKVAAAPRQTPASLSVPVPAPAEPPPVGAHFAGRPRPARGASGDGRAEPPPERPQRSHRTAPVPDPAEPPRLPLGDFDDTPDTRGSRLGPPD